MRVTYVGHAGLHIETEHGRILCDPWVNPAYFASWFPFPDNAHLDWDRLGQVDYLYVSHLHRDHFDPELLAAHVDRSATVLLPAFPTRHLRDGLGDVGFRTFVELPSGAAVEHRGLRLMSMALVAPTDGPIGDSLLAVDDGTARILNLNDARPTDLDPLVRFGPFDAHFLQFSGAIWYPMVYELPADEKAELGRSKRVGQMDRARRYVEAIGARHVVPIAGPPCFLDDDLASMNDVDRDPTNVFPDQTVFLETLADAGIEGGTMVIPGTTLDLAGGRCLATHPVAPGEVAAIFTDKSRYLKEMAARKRSLIDAERASWPNRAHDVTTELRSWFEPLLARADRLCGAVDGSVLLDLGDVQVVIDFQARTVGPPAGQDCHHVFRVDRRLIEACIADHTEDWVNRLFLSCRFSAWRTGRYNEHVFTFFKCLSPERMEYCEWWLGVQHAEEELVELGDWLVPRHCPHRGADLTRFGVIEDGILTCTLHHWQFDLDAGTCLTSADCTISSRRRPRWWGEGPAAQPSS